MASSVNDPEATVDSILQEIPECLVDANYYYYKKFQTYDNICHSKNHFNLSGTFRLERHHKGHIMWPHLRNTC